QRRRVGRGRVAGPHLVRRARPAGQSLLPGLLGADRLPGVGPGLRRLPVGLPAIDGGLVPRRPLPAGAALAPVARAVPDVRGAAAGVLAGRLRGRGAVPLVAMMPPSRWWPFDPSPSS